MKALARPLAAASELEPLSISVVGLGLLGTVSVACLAHLGFRVVGVDLSFERVRNMKEGRSAIVEDGLAGLLQDGVAQGRIEATQNLVAAVLDTDITVLAVEAPAAADGRSDPAYVRHAARAIGQALAMKSCFHAVVLRSCVAPGTTLEVVSSEIAKASGRACGDGYGVCFNPEFLREGAAVADFLAPRHSVIGADDARTALIVSRMYAKVDAAPIRTSVAAAEMMKHVDTLWRATKAAFADEVGRLCDPCGIDAHAVMSVLASEPAQDASHRL